MIRWKIQLSDGECEASIRGFCCEKLNRRQPFPLSETIFVWNNKSSDARANLIARKTFAWLEELKWKTTKALRAQRKFYHPILIPMKNIDFFTSENFSISIFYRRIKLQRLTESFCFSVWCGVAKVNFVFTVTNSRHSEIFQFRHANFASFHGFLRSMAPSGKLDTFHW